MQAIKAVFLDLSGVLYEGEQAIDGAADTIKQLRQQGLLLRFVTNTATSSSAAIIGKLAGMAIQVNDDELYTAPIATYQYLQQQQLRPYCLVHPAITAVFADLPQQQPNCVVLGDARQGLHYDSLNRAFQLCHQGSPLIGIGMNKYFKDEQGLQLDAGPFIRAIEWAAGTKATIMGKPSQVFFNQVVSSTPLSAEQCLMVGDDAINDVKGAIDAGLQGLLVRTGKYQRDDENQLPDKAAVINAITELPKLIC